MSGKPQGSAATATAPAAPEAGDIECITRDPVEAAIAARKRPRCLEVCTGRADLLAASPECVEAGCGGHPICRPCYDVCDADGWIVRDAP